MDPATIAAIAATAKAGGDILQSLGAGQGGPKYAVTRADLWRIMNMLMEEYRAGQAGNLPGYGKEIVGKRYGLAQKTLAPAFERAQKFALTGARQRLSYQPQVAGFLGTKLRGEQTGQLADLYSGFDIEDELARREAMARYLQSYLGLAQLGYAQGH